MWGRRTLWVAVVVAAGLVGAAVALRGPCARLTAAHWRGQLATVPDARAEVLLRQAADLGEPGIPVLVEALGSQRESVARAGRRILEERLGRWQTRGGAAGSRSQALLVESLADRVARFGPTARSDAVELATQVLAWLPNTRSVDRDRMLGACQRVFRAGIVDRRPLVADRRSAEEADGQPGSTRATGLLPEDPMVAQRSRLPGGGLDIEATAMPELPPLRAAAASDAGLPPGVASDGDRPRPLEVPDGAQPLRGAGASGPSSAAGPPPSGPTEPAGPDGSPAVPSAPYAASADGPPEDLSGIATPELLGRLRSGDRPTATRARLELERRGFTAVHFGLARRLFDPDPEVRRQLVQVLPGVQSVNAAPWLLLLCRDADAEVRLAAVSTALTSGDPDLRRQVEQLAQADPDPRIRRQATRVAAERSRRPY